jgi:hypothetical protein
MKIEPLQTSMYERTLAVLQGKPVNRLPFVTRLETWYKSHLRSGTLPDRLKELSLPEIHRSIDVGQLKFLVPYALKLRNVEVTASFNGETFYKEWEPVIENFPGMWDVVSNTKAGETITNLVTPMGRLRLRHETLPEGILFGTEPYLKEHLIRSPEDYKTVAYILERAEFVPQFEKIYQEQISLGDNAFVVPLLHRIPFQQVLLEYLGELQFFYALHDERGPVESLLHLLDQQMLSYLKEISGLDVPYVEFPDNLHGMMTNPKLFIEYCLPAYQAYTEMLHSQSKKVGSHTDGDVRLLLGLLKESGLDVCESFSPFPLTSCTFEEAWDVWQGGPLIWGGIPSPILEEDTSQEDFETFIDQVFQMIGHQPAILGVVDLFMRHNSIERVEQIARRLSCHYTAPTHSSNSV